MPCAALNADNVSAFYSLSGFYFDLMQMTIVIVKTVCAFDTDVLSKFLIYIIRILPTGEVDCAADGCVYLFAVDAHKINTVM